MNYQTYVEIKRLQGEGLKAGQISAYMGLDVKTVREWLKKERFEERKKVKRETILKDFEDDIRRLLNRHPYTAVQIYQMLKDKGYKGSECTVRRYVAKIRPSKTQVFLTLHFSPGEAAQVDFAYCGTIDIGNTKRRLYLFVMTLCYSRMMYAEFTMGQGLEFFLSCHKNAFKVFNGVPRKIIVDNCKTAITYNSIYSTAEVNRFYADMAGHYGFEVIACGIRKPHEKGRVERSIGYIRTSFLNVVDNPVNVELLNNSLLIWLTEIANKRIHSTTKKQPVVLFEAEQKSLIPLTKHPYDTGINQNIRVNSQANIVFDTNRYSIPHKFANKNIIMRKYPDKLLFFNENTLIAEHVRSFQRNCHIIDPDHEKNLISHFKKAANHKIIKEFLALSPDAEEFYKQMKIKEINPIYNIKKIMALIPEFGEKNVAEAIHDAVVLKACNSQFVLSIIQQRRSFNSLNQNLPLLVMKNKDALNIKIKQQSTDIYNQIIP